MNTRIYLALAFLIGSFSAFASGAGEETEDNTTVIVTDDGIEYGICSQLGSWEYEPILKPDQCVSVTGYKGTNTSVIIPSSITSDGKKYAVMGIEASAFKGLPIKEVSIGDLRRIGEHAFAETDLRRITLSSGIASIGRGAFLDTPVETVCCTGETPIPSRGYDYMYLTSDKFKAGYSNIFRSRDVECTILPDRTLDPSLESLHYDTTIPATLYVPKESIPEYRKLTFYTSSAEFTDKGGVWGYFEKIEPLENYDPSGVESVEAVSPDAPAAVYDLCGRTVLTEAAESDLRNLPKGIYIYKGRKIII